MKNRFECSVSVVFYFGFHDLPNPGTFGCSTASQHAQVSVCDSLLKADPTPSIRDKSRQDGQTSTNLLFAFAISPREWQGGQNRADEVAHVW